MFPNNKLIALPYPDNSLTYPVIFLNARRLIPDSVFLIRYLTVDNSLVFTKRTVFKSRFDILRFKKRIAQATDHLLVLPCTQSPLRFILYIND